MIRSCGSFKIKIICLFSVFLLLMSGCGAGLSSPYASSTLASEIAGRGFVADLRADSFAHDLCVVTRDIPVPGLEQANSIEAILLVDVNNAEPLAAVNAHRQIHPASTTKLMTALIALENCSMDEKIVLGQEVTGFRYDEQVLPGHVGDTMTMDQALHFMLMYSANDISNAIAVHIAGSLSEFCDMMNEKARAIGATNTHFSNPHGLDADDHMTTAYDLYLILSECIKYDKFTEIVSSAEYSTVYYDVNGNSVERTVRSTDLFIRSDKDVDPPSGITVIGGKTGTTGGAGHCLIVLCRDPSGNPYISCVMGTPDTDTLYDHQQKVMSLILNR
ncbi:MAG: serine hydrolase [Lachnospiraceae bacterium]|nr:serine hydrolase [Lachnospiraceae bacterium]